MIRPTILFQKEELTEEFGSHTVDNQTPPRIEDHSLALLHYSLYWDVLCA